MNHIEAQVLDIVAKLNPEVFGALDVFWEGNQEFLDDTVAEFDREVHFYLAYLRFIGPLKKAGLPFCYPQVSGDSKAVRATETFDLALAHKLVGERKSLVYNDFYLQGAERLLVVSGPNQGGKTTMARTFGQLHFLAGLGLTVPGRRADVVMFDELFTHFERGENLADMRGKLQDDLIRVHSILESATDRSVIVINEIFTSTTLRDAVELGTELLRRILEVDCLCVCVTFADEPSTLTPDVVSMVSTVVADDPTVRTYKVVRKAADGRSYAQAIAEKYGLSYEVLKERIGR